MPDPDTFAVECPMCSTRLRAGTRLIGRKVKCPKCGLPIEIEVPDGRKPAPKPRKRRPAPDPLPEAVPGPAATTAPRSRNADGFVRDPGTANLARRKAMVLAGWLISCLVLILPAVIMHVSGAGERRGLRPPPPKSEMDACVEGATRLFRDMHDAFAKASPDVPAGPFLRRRIWDRGHAHRMFKQETSWFGTEQKKFIHGLETKPGAAAEYFGSALKIMEMKIRVTTHEYQYLHGPLPVGLLPLELTVTFAGGRISIYDFMVDGGPVYWAPNLKKYWTELADRKRRKGSG